MICCRCDRTMELCICEDADERLTSLVGASHIDQDWVERVRVGRAVNKGIIAKAREEAVQAGGKSEDSTT